MKIIDVYTTPMSKSPVGSKDPSGVTVDLASGDEKSGDMIYIARNKFDEPVGRMEVRSWIVVSLSMARMKFATPLINALCKAADSNNSHIFIPTEGLRNVRDKRFMERFGFLTTSEGVMERLPGAALPYSVI